MKKMHHAISWFEIPAADLARAKKFYETILEMEMVDLDIGTGLKMALFPADEGTIGGAINQHKDFYHPSQQGALVYLNANPDLQQVLDRIEKAGGKLVVPKTQISEEYGFMAVFIDSEGNRVALQSMS